MADIPPINPGAPIGAVPPPKKETGKVQPKKETVRISLPPKPTAAPTIKLPTLPPGGPTGASTGSPLVPMPPSATTLKSSATPAAKPATPAVAPTTAAPAARRPVAAPVVATISPIDKILAIAAAVVALAAIGTTVWMLMILNDALTQ